MGDGPRRFRTIRSAGLQTPCVTIRVRETPVMRRIIICAAGLLLGGCVAHAAYDVVTLPVRAGSQVVDWTTTSRSEADRNLGRKVRKQRERDARDAKKEARREREAQRTQ
jgi:hypothetical protein